MSVPGLWKDFQTLLVHLVTTNLDNAEGVTHTRPTAWVICANPHRRLKACLTLTVQCLLFRQRFSFPSSYLFASIFLPLFLPHVRWVNS